MRSNFLRSSLYSLQKRKTQKLTRLFFSCSSLRIRFSILLSWTPELNTPLNWPYGSSPFKMTYLTKSLIFLRQTYNINTSIIYTY